MKVKEGDYLLAVNGRPMDTSMDPWAAFQGLAGEVVRLTVSRTPDANDANDVLVQPMSSEFRLRNLAWIESNRRKVEEATQGRVGYIYVPDTSINGQNELVRQFGPQCDKDALVIDERFNSGGQIPDRFIELLNRPTYNYWARRDHRDWQTPTLAHTGPKVMIMNGWSGSGGDAFPYYFREAGLGPLVGTRTWGGLVGMSGNPQLIDGGSRHGSDLRHVRGERLGRRRLRRRSGLRGRERPARAGGRTRPAAGDGGRRRPEAAGEGSAEAAEEADVSESLGQRELNRPGGRKEHHRAAG